MTSIREHSALGVVLAFGFAVFVMCVATAVHG